MHHIRIVLNMLLEVKIKESRLFLTGSMPGFVPQLTLELINAIILQATLPTLLALRPVNSICRDIANKWLYRSLLLGNMVTTITSSSKHSVRNQRWPSMSIV